MRIQIINSGNELLSGAVLNTNLPAMAQLLRSIDWSVEKAYIVGDDRKALWEAMHSALMECDILILTGGLGTTDDDLSREIASEFFSLKLRSDENLRRKLHALWRERYPQIPIPKAHYRQADVPEGAEILDNTVGSAPGLFIKGTYNGRERQLYLLPGPPAEMEAIVQNSLLPRWKKLKVAKNYSSGFLVVGGMEPMVQLKVHECRARLPDCPVEVAYCATYYGTRVFVTGNDLKMVDQFVTDLRGAFGDDALLPGEFAVAEGILRLAEEKVLSLALAESCTGGLAANILCETPGISAIFKGGIICYSNSAKMSLLGVKKSTLGKFGAVSCECAKEMAQGALKALNSQIGVAITGIAGPGGGSVTKPVGTVYIAVKYKRKVTAEEFHFVGNRRSIRERAAARALVMLYKMLMQAQ